MLVRLPPDALERYRRIRDARCAANRGRENYRISDKSDFHITDVGVFCEVAVEVAEGKRVNVEVHHGTGLREATNGKPDVGEWEVKGTELWWGRLLVPVHLAHKHALDRKYLLVYPDIECAVALLAGWAWGHEFIGRSDCIMHNLPKPAYTPKALHPYQRRYGNGCPPAPNAAM